ESTLSDARKQAQGKRGARAPSQVQLEFGDTERKPAREQTGAEADSTDDGSQAVPSRTNARPLLQPRTFLGTVPCLNGNAGCPASRITLTFAPSGEWRSRTQLLDSPGSAQPIVQQGCWNVIGTDPLRIALQTSEQAAARASFAFVNDDL